MEWTSQKARDQAEKTGKPSLSLDKESTGIWLQQKHTWNSLFQIHICMGTKVEMDEKVIGYYKLLSGIYYLSYALIWCFRSGSLKAIDLLKVGSQVNLQVVNEAGWGNGRS